MSSTSHTLSPIPAPPVLIREAVGSDRPALRRLAERDSARLPDAPLMVAEVAGELQAAITLDARVTIADPFRQTTEVVALLRARADQVRRARSRPLRIVARTPLRPLSRAAA